MHVLICEGSIPEPTESLLYIGSVRSRALLPLTASPRRFGDVPVVLLIALHAGGSGIRKSCLYQGGCFHEET